MGSGGPGSGEDGIAMEYDGVKDLGGLGCEWLGAWEGVAKGPITFQIAAWGRHSRRTLEGATHGLEQATGHAQEFARFAAPFATAVVRLRLGICIFNAGGQRESSRVRRLGKTMETLHKVHLGRNHRFAMIANFTEHVT